VTLTEAMREALGALEEMEAQLIPQTQWSFLTKAIEQTMLCEPGNWALYYQGGPGAQKLLRLYSYSDRVRYYWRRPKISAAVARLISNLSSITIPESMLGRYLPAQYLRQRDKQIAGDPVSLIVDRSQDVLRNYAAARNQGAV
jgi:D-tagatose-1,6-bisphosphate aldolase subunit GatZ/KbaZ